MAKKLIKKSTQRGLFKAVAFGTAAVVVAAVIIPATKLSAKAPKLWVDIHGFFTDVKTSVVEDAPFIALAIAIVFGVMYFYRKKGK